MAKHGSSLAAVGQIEPNLDKAGQNRTSIGRTRPNRVQTWPSLADVFRFGHKVWLNWVRHCSTLAHKFGGHRVNFGLHSGRRLRRRSSHLAAGLGLACAFAPGRLSIIRSCIRYEKASRCNLVRRALREDQRALKLLAAHVATGFVTSQTLATSPPRETTRAHDG